jgi:hypothetical protein
MHKSVRLFTFGLLASSLVMLAAMPFLNQNNFLNAAMAQGYDNYYGDNSSYSQYPTDDKKYECRTGPLEGFFVSSVEFCKNVKFDNDDSRKDHNRDTKTGPQGPAGPQGQPGSGNNNSTLVNTFNCINTNNININTDTNQSSSSSNGIQPVQDTIAQGLNGTLDGLSQINLNKTIINLCFINDNDTIVIENGGGNGTDGNATGTCEDCFNKILSPKQIDDILALLIDSGFENLEDLCTLFFLNSEIGGGVSYSLFVGDLLKLDIPIATVIKLVECLINTGIVFIP